MKKLFTLLSLFVFCMFFSFTLLGQEIIEIPLSAKKSSSTLKLKVIKSSPLVIRFVGINPLKYTYALNHQFVNLYSENPIDIPSLLNGKTAAINVNVDSLKNSFENQIESLSDSIAAKKTASQNAKKMQKSIMDKEIELLEDEVENIKRKLKNLEDETLSFFRKVFVEYNDEADLLNVNLIEGENSDLLNSRNAYKLILQRFVSIKTNMENEIARAKSQENFDLATLRLTIGDYQSENEANLIEYKKMIENYPYPEDVPIYISKESIENNLKEIKKKVDLVNSLQDSIQTLPLDYHGENIDFIKVSLEIVPIDEKAKPVNQIKNYDYKVWIKGGWKIDFSAGIFLSSLRDRSFLTIKQESTENEGDNLYKIIKEDQGKYEFGIGSTVNFNFRNASFTSFGGSVGGYVTSDQKFRFIAGPTLILGKMERVIFSFGVVMGEITALSNKVNLNDTFDLGSDGTVPTVQKFDFGRYFSFTYNLGKAKGKEK